MSPQLTTTENTITYHNFQFILGPFRPRETKENAYGKFWGRQTKNIMVCYGIFCSGPLFQ